MSYQSAQLRRQLSKEVQKCDIMEINHFSGTCLTYKEVFYALSQMPLHQV